MVEPPIREALAAAGEEATALDIACNEGWYAHRLLEWGAARVAASDWREINVRRARLIRDHFGISSERLEVSQADLFDLDPAQIGRFDVVCLLGVVYHLENPIGAIRVARSLTTSLCVIESQVTRLDDPIELGYSDGEVIRERGSFAVHRESPADTQLSPLAAMPGLVSLIPNRAALLESALAAGFASAELVAEPTGADGRPLRGDRALVLARC
jgi:tRNA (mo5U34)-methyltransferase